MNTQEANTYSQPTAHPLENGLPLLDRAKRTVAGKLHQAAQVLHEKGQQSVNRNLAEYGYRSANWLDQAANYVNDINAQKVQDDVQAQVRRNPSRALLIAGGVGLLLGALIRRR